MVPPVPPAAPVPPPAEPRSRAVALPACVSTQVAAMAKKGLHPEWHSEAKVICNGEEVLTTSGTQGSYTGAANGC